MSSRTAVVAWVLFLLTSVVGCGSGNGSKNNNVEAVFIGSSQTVDWNLARSFPGRNFVNRGVLSDASTEILARFQTDVIGLKPRVVVIWAGENDIDHGLPISAAQANIESMRQEAVNAGIRVVVCTIPPKTGSDADQNPRIVDFNARLRSFAAAHNVQLADFYATLSDASGNLKPGFANGNEHLSTGAYDAIAPVAAAAITASEQ